VSSFQRISNLPTAQPFRGVQFPAYLFGLEQLVDQVAEELDMDPVEIRLKNTFRTGDKMKPFGAVLSNFPVEECINKGLEASGFRDIWKGWNKPVKEENSKRKGIGMAFTMGWGGDWQKHRSNATVKIHPDATAELFTGAQDIGTGCNTTLSQIAAEELGLPLDRIKLIAGDTRLTPDDWGACGSRTLHSAGTAVVGAAKKAKEALIGAASLRLSVERENVEFKDGELFVKGEMTPLSDIIKEPVSAAYNVPMEETVAPLYNAYHMGVATFHVAEVEVDIETGEIKVLRFTASEDAGKAIDPAVVEGQMYGGALQGLGYSLIEELLFDEASGRSLNPDFMDYKIYDFQDAPDIELVLVESDEPSGPFGAIGVGEHCINPVAGAVANAVYNAIGTRLYEIPMTPERVLKALGKI
jgi:xanthine dehydrogenase molybdenum-binding subunit